jgi:hypothetical protein
MLDTKLIIIDGLSGSGKSTTCQWLELQLRRNEYRARWFWEGDIDHPLHWWTFWDGREYLPPDFAGITISEFIETSLGNWRQFVAVAQAGETLYVAESVLLLMAVGQLLQGDPPPAQLLAYGQRVQALIRPLKPVLIYFRQTEIASRFRKVWDFRGQTIENELIGHMERRPYFQHRNLKGVPGIISLWEETQQLHDQLVAGYPFPKLVIDINDSEYPLYYRQILDFLVLQFIEDETLAGENQLAKFVGSYKSGEAQAQVKLKNGRLLLHLPEAPVASLTPITSHSFYVGVTPPIAITFLEDPEGTVQEVCLDSTRLGGGNLQAWKRE